MRKISTDQFTIEHHKLSDCHEAIYFHHRQTHEAILAINTEVIPSEHLLDSIAHLHKDCLEGWGIDNTPQDIIVHQIFKR